MKILFFLEPGLEQGNPYFRYATLRNSIFPQAQVLNKEYEVTLVSSEQIINKAIIEGYSEAFSKVIGINSLLWSQKESSHSVLTRYQKNEIHANEIEHIKDCLESKLGKGYQPDLIIVWESPAYYFSSIYPSAKVMYQSPGFFSRAPYPSLILCDTKLLNNEIILNDEIQDGSLEKLDLVREDYKNLLKQYNPLVSELDDVYERFEKIVLYPLQIDNYFMINSVLPDGVTQFDLLVDVLKKAPTNIGIWVTNYKSKDIQSDVLSIDSIKYLRESFDNFIYFEKCNEIPSVSQFLVPFIDGVVTVSSSVGYQAAFYNKQLCILGEKNHLSPFVSAENLEEFYKNINNDISNNKDIIIYNTIKNKHLSDAFMSSDSYLAWIEEYIKTGKMASWTENVDIELNKLKRDTYLHSDMNYLYKNESSSKFCHELSSRIKNYDVISFDIFDTLLYRPFKKPSDLFKFMEPSVYKILGDQRIDFFEARRKAEQRAFNKAVEQGRGEITLQEIYAQMGIDFNLSVDAINHLAELEMEFELQFLYPRQSGKAAFNEALALGKTVIIISDMYLSQDFLAKVLLKNGYIGYEKLFVSSSYGVKKHHGKLFDAVLSEVVYPASSILHIGDNEIGDIKQASSRGLATFHLNKAMDLFEQNSSYLRPWLRDSESHSLDWRMILSIWAQKLHDNPRKKYRKGTVFNGDHEILGYMGFGGLLLGYTKWLIEKSIRDGIDTLYFLSRDGKIMKQSYDIVSRIYPNAPKAVYMLCSRRSVNLAKVKDLSDILDLLYVDFAHRTSLGHLLENRFGLTYELVDENNLKKFGLSWTTKLTKDDLPRLTSLMPLLSADILKVAHEERSVYLEYLDNIGFNQADKKIAIVDIGYAGTMQESLYQLTGKNISGYYLITFRKALERLDENGLDSKGYLAEFIDRHDTYHPFCRHVPLYETLFSTTDTSFIKMSKTWDDKLNPVFMEQVASEQTRLEFIEQVHRGALEFIDDAITILDQNFKAIDLEPNKTLRLLDQLFNDPHPLDARLFSGIVFEDAYGGVQRKVILPIEAEISNGGVWRKGIEIIEKDLSRKEHKQCRQRIKNEGQALAHQDLTFSQKIIYNVMLYTLKNKKKQKFLKNPQLFFYDSKNNMIKKLGEWYLSGNR